jgi:hypothetical protein
MNIQILKNIKNFLYNQDEPIQVDQAFNRLFPNHYFIDVKQQDAIERYGYTTIKNALTRDQLSYLQLTFQKLTQFKSYSIAVQFQNSGRFKDPEIRNFVMESIGIFSKSFLPTLFNSDIYDENTTGAFQIKPPSNKSTLNPHQDAPVIDETKENGLFVWIPLCDITESNGAIMVLPGSHLWGNHQRSLNVPWPFEPHTKLLWKHMKPICLNKGDILIWDTALIHASLPNLSRETRIAITTTLLPKDFKMVEYFMDKKTPKGMVEKYQVERSFWENEDIMKRPPCPPNEYLGLEPTILNQTLNSNFVEKLLSQTNLHFNQL